MLFGTRSEKLRREVEQAEALLKQHEQDSDRYSGREDDPQVPRQLRQSRHRRPLPAHLPREIQRLESEESCCPECGGELDYLGEVSAEQLELVSSALKVIRTERVKKACTKCDCIVEAPAPSRPIERGIAGPGLPLIRDPMMNHLYEQLTALKLTGFRDALKKQLAQPGTYQELGFEERLSLLTAEELTCRENRKAERLIKHARFRLNAELSKLDYRNNRGLDRALIRSLSQGNWLTLKQNILLTGATGSGKTFLGCALGHNACRQGYKVYYYRLKALMEQCYQGHADGRYSKLLTRLNNSDLLLLDDWGLEPLSSEQRSDLLEIVDLMYQRGSIIVVSQLPVENWYKMIGDSTHADAILDRLVHGSIKIELKGESMRKIQSPLTEGDQ